jgi:mono/diheme cytochrome c family protein
MQTWPMRGAQSNMRFLPRAAALAGASALLLFAACGGSGYKPSTDEPATLYLEACASCHQGGEAGPSLAGLGLTADQVEARLSRGGKGMPSFPGIRGKARANLVDFVVRLSAAPAADPSPP